MGDFWQILVLPLRSGLIRQDIAGCRVLTGAGGLHVGRWSFRPRSLRPPVRDAIPAKWAATRDVLFGGACIRPSMDAAVVRLQPCCPSWQRWGFCGPRFRRQFNEYALATSSWPRHSSRFATAAWATGGDDGFPGATV